MLPKSLIKKVYTKKDYLNQRSTFTFRFGSVTAENFESLKSISEVSYLSNGSVKDGNVLKVGRKNMKKCVEYLHRKRCYN